MKKKSEKKRRIAVDLPEATHNAVAVLAARENRTVKSQSEYIITKAVQDEKKG